ncbi:acetyltransferase [Methylobacterium sp. NEAU K]|uniref:acetyltransferase n=1 Tax=Methylobacterium sp. NEAU K TaxID=3064946 RepID=UPI0027338E97|nr:acetyltransferase [Methylobacterium sp. NEAU K]MDP4005514.1 acetyltransferase [Methylobacterium sp. NEAU K]
MTRRLVMCGGGSLAVEIATFLRDLDAGERGDDVLVTDVVSPGAGRAVDLTAVCGNAFTTHADIASVVAKEAKQFIVCIGDPVVRHTVYVEIVRLGLTLARIVHPRAYISPSAVIGDGAIVYPGVFIGPFAQVGENVLLNAQVVIGHDARLDDSVVLSPSARLCGHAVCGTAAFLGTGASILPNVSLGAYSKLTAGSVLSRSVGDGFLMHGNPAAGRHMYRVPTDEAT